MSTEPRNTADPDLDPKPTDTTGLVLVGLLLLVLGWAYWPPLRDMLAKWTSDPQYSQGYVVPLFALFLVWRNREKLAHEDCTPSLWGLLLLAVGVATRLAGTALYFDWLEGVSLIPVLCGVSVLLWGWRGLRHTWYAWAFLFFMVPLPYRVETGLSHPLQRIATISSTYSLQTLGFPAFAEGNVIVVNDHRIGIIEACNGLGMLMLFFALSVGVAILTKRHWLDRVLLVLAAVPIAVLANTIRITLNTIIRDKVSERLADVLHDYAGWEMMPLALGMLWLLLKMIDLVLVDTSDEEMTSPLDLRPFQAAPPVQG